MRGLCLVGSGRVRLVEFSYKESRAVPDGAAVVGTAVGGPDVTTAITHTQTHISLALTVVKLRPSVL